MMYCGTTVNFSRCQVRHFTATRKTSGWVGGWVHYTVISTLHYTVVCRRTLCIHTVCTAFCVHCAVDRAAAAAAAAAAASAVRGRMSGRLQLVSPALPPPPSPPPPPPLHCCDSATDDQMRLPETDSRPMKYPSPF